MDENGKVLCKCKYVGIGYDFKTEKHCSHSFDCIYYFPTCSNESWVTWTFYLINRQHLIEVKDE